MSISNVLQKKFLMHVKVRVVTECAKWCGPATRWCKRMTSAQRGCTEPGEAFTPPLGLDDGRSQHRRCTDGADAENAPVGVERCPGLPDVGTHAAGLRSN